MNAEDILKAKYPADLAKALVDSYREIESNYVLGKWKVSELDSGHFVEAARRVLELELTGSYTRINEQLSKFSDAVLKQYENAAGDDSYRLLIPRALKAIYNIRNKRGVGHVGGVSPNEMDATYILYTVKWVLAEIVRLASGASIQDTQKAVDEIVERTFSVIWKHGDVTRILDTSLGARSQVLILLYDSSSQTETKLRESTEYSNPTKFRVILRELHGKRLIEYLADGSCVLTPKGTLEAEQLLIRAGFIQ
jgi:hypothetical protein